MPVFCASLADIFEDWQGQILDHKGRQLLTINGGEYFTEADMTDKEAWLLCRDMAGVSIANEKIANADNEPGRFNEAINIIKMVHGFETANTRKSELACG